MKTPEMETGAPKIPENEKINEPMSVEKYKEMNADELKAEHAKLVHEIETKRQDAHGFREDKKVIKQLEKIMEDEDIEFKPYER